MKNKILLLALVFMAVLPMVAQNESKPLSIGVEAGLSINNYTNSSRMCREGFYAGLRGRYQFDDFYVSAGLRYIRKGSDALDGESDSDDFYEANYLELPINIGITGRLGRRAVIFGETGPYFAYGLSGKYKGESWPDGVTRTWNLKFFSSDNGSPRRFDPGWNARVGVRFGSLEVSAGYEIGFTTVWNVAKAGNEGVDCRNSNFTIGLAYTIPVR